jgi:hypothetical protein
MSDPIPDMVVPALRIEPSIIDAAVAVVPAAAFMSVM